MNFQKSCFGYHSFFFDGWKSNFKNMKKKEEEIKICKFQFPSSFIILLLYQKITLLSILIFFTQKILKNNFIKKKKERKLYGYGLNTSGKNQNLSKKKKKKRRFKNFLIN